MSSDPRRRRSGLLLAGLLLFEGIAMPLGVCAQGHEEHHSDADAPMAQAEAVAPHGVDHARAGHEPAGEQMPTDQGSDGHHDSSPSDCVAMAGCGVPALGLAPAVELPGTIPSYLGGVVVRHDRPLAVDLGISTPPPRG